MYGQEHEMTDTIAIVIKKEKRKKEKKTVIVLPPRHFKCQNTNKMLHDGSVLTTQVKQKLF